VKNPHPQPSPFAKGEGVESSPFNMSDEGGHFLARALRATRRYFFVNVLNLEPFFDPWVTVLPIARSLA